MQGGRTTKRLSVRTRDGATEGELEATVVIELYAEIRGKEILTLDNKDQNGETGLAIRIRSQLPKNAVEMRYALRHDLEGAAWVGVDNTKIVEVASEGDYTAFVQFRDRDLAVSDIYAAYKWIDSRPLASSLLESALWRPSDAPHGGVRGAPVILSWCTGREILLSGAKRPR